jgi:phosphatidate cytidylyltransferase
VLRTRVLAALIFAPALAGIVYLGGLALEISCFIIAMLALYEFLELTLGKGLWYAKAFAFAGGALVCWSILGWPHAIALSMLWPGSTIVIFLAVLARPEPIDTSIRRASFMAFGIAYGAGLVPFLARLRELPDGFALAFAALFCTWAADTGAYFAGRFLGRHKLYPKISPSKTVEGFVGGLVAAVAAAVAIQVVFHVPITLVDAVAIGSIAAVFGVAGDLCESMLKRSVGAKDSSALIPGHGGVLDRFDAVMFVAPAVYLYVDLFVY